MHRSISVVVVAALTTAAAAPLHAQAGISAVDTRSSLYLAGGNTYSLAPVGGQPGIAPAGIALTAGTGRELTVSASGSATFCGGGTCVSTTPDGPAIAGTNLNASGSISGIVAPTSGFLAGVFLGPTLPGSAPASLDFTALGIDFAVLSPTLGQLFFIGNGFTAGAVQQRFLVPDAATQLFFGIADGGSFVGNPGFYDDNVGTYVANYSVAPATVVPEPATAALLATGLAIVGAVAGRRRGLA